MAKHKYYAVKKGKSEGIFESWDECKKSVDGVAGAQYKSFSSLEEAEAYLQGTDLIEKHVQQATSLDTVIAYVDGSYDDSMKKYSYGCVLITPNGEIIGKNGSNNDADALESRNVAGELMGVMFAIKWVSDNGFSQVLIRHDYEGISKWFLGEWKARSYCAIKYIEYLSKFKDRISISFEKVTGHSGDKYNELADRLAKKAIKTKAILNSGDTHFTVEGIECIELETLIQIVKERTENFRFESIKEDGKTSFILINGKEKVYVINYNTGKTVVQGKPSSLFDTFVSLITELLSIEDITPTLNKWYNIDIEKSQIDVQILEFLPNITNYHSDKFKASLHQAIYNLNLNGDMPDFTFLVHPALRALDGHLRYIMCRYGVPIIDKFDMYEQHQNRGFKLKDEYKANFGSPAKISYVTRAYNFYHDHRNKLFHWDTPIGKVDTTVMVSSKSEADRLIMDTLRLINEYYITM